MKARFWVSFEAELDSSMTKVRKVTAVNMTQGYPKNPRGIPIEFEVDVPDEFFLDRRVKIEAAIDPPGVGAAPPTVTTNTKWDEAKARHNV
jgi:hypothetical protein